MNPATDRRLAEIRARLQRATPGPWEASPEEDGVYADSSMVTSRPRSCSVARGIEEPRDAELIAHAPADLAWLLDRLADAEGRAEEAARHHDELNVLLSHHPDILDALPPLTGAQMASARLKIAIAVCLKRAGIEAPATSCVVEVVDVVQRDGRPGVVVLGPELGSVPLGPAVLVHP